MARLEVGIEQADGADEFEEAEVPATPDEVVNILGLCRGNVSILGL